jgi:RecJ-like exonuclease
MKIRTKFSCGDKVFAINRESKTVSRSCPACGGFGRITLLDATTANCPNCYGYGEIHSQEPVAYRVTLRNATVGSVRYEYTNFLGVDGETLFDNYKPQRKIEERYMLVETGVGGGSLWSVDDLFLTEAEAQSEADARNNSAQKGE